MASFLPPSSNVWDPIQIIAQIVAIQALFYVSLGLLQWMLVGPYVPHLEVNTMFDWRWVSFKNFQGWMVAVATLANALAAAAYLRFIIKRAKKCLDFAATCYLIHLVAVGAYSGLPSQAAWWVVLGSSLAVTAVLGEWLCMRLELAEIPLASLAGRRAVSGGSRTSGVVELSAVGAR